MTKINDEMKSLLDETDIWVLASADNSGMPNAVPIFFTKILDNGNLLLVDNFMNKTLENIKQNPKVSVSVWKDKAGYQFKGTAVIETDGANFEQGEELAKGRNPKGVVVVALTSVYTTAPGPDAGKKLL